MLVLPQPEPICLAIRVDALGVHELGLYPTETTLDHLVDWLPHGDVDETDRAVEADSVLASANDPRCLPPPTTPRKDPPRSPGGAKTWFWPAMAASYMRSVGIRTTARAWFVVSWPKEAYVTPPPA